MKKILLFIVIVAAVAAGALIVTRKPTSNNSTTPASETDKGSMVATETPGTSVTGEVKVTYDGSKFMPAKVTVKPGTKVNFVNQSSGPMWVASDPHPVHTDFSALDAHKGYIQGQTYSFTFDQEGEYGYHNHLNSVASGTVVVE